MTQRQNVRQPPQPNLKYFLDRAPKTAGESGHFEAVKKMTNEVLIGIGGLILSVLTYFAGVWRTEKRHATEERQTRIRRVFERYMEFRKTNLTGGYDGLQKAGISTLASNDEIVELVELIVAHGELHPLGSDYKVTFEGVDLLQFFKFAAETRINFLRTPVESVITESGARSKK